MAELRPATNGQNKANARAYRNNKTGLKAVSKYRDKWVAQIYKDRCRKYLGSFSTPEEAHAAYCQAAREYHGEFARGREQTSEDRT